MGVALSADSDGVLVRLAIAGLAIGAAKTVTELGDLARGPVTLRQTGDQSGHHRGLSHAARVPAHHYDRHYFSLVLDASRARVANSFRYCLTGLAGVPQKTTPGPSSFFLGRMPPCPPTMTPSPIRA